MSKQELANKAREFKTSNPQEGYQLCLKIWNEHKEEFNNYDATLTIGLARKVEDTDFKMIYDILQTFPEDAIVLGNGGWYLFDKFIKNKQPNDISNNLVQIEGFLNIVKQKNLSEEDSYPCPFTISIFKVVDALANNMFNASRILDFLKRLNPEYLSKTPEAYEHSTRGTIEKMSPFEKYYSYKTKALLKLERYDECKEACDIALQNIDKYHYDNQIWFPMRKALSLEHLGAEEESEAMFKELIESREGSSKWFLFRDLAELYFDQDNFKKAWKFSIDSALLGNDAKFLIKLYHLQARILFKLGRPDDGKIFAEMIASILKENEWRVQQSYLKLFNYYQIDVSQALAVKPQQKLLNKFLSADKYKDRIEIKGTITTIHNNGKSGFIKDDVGQQYFFGKGDLVKKTRNLDVLLNAEVAFYSGKKTERSISAEAIRIIALVKSEYVKSDLDKYVGKTDSGRITKLDDIGIFVTDIYDKNFGLIHKSKLPNDFKETYQKGSPLEVVLVRINKQGKLDLKLANS